MRRNQAGNVQSLICWVIKYLEEGVVPRSCQGQRTQLSYLRSMDKNDVVFGIGPAGTGKTYLAVASAINAFKTGKKKSRKISSYSTSR